MNLYYNGVDIYGDVSVNYCVHEMFAEKQADTLVIRFNDTKGTWSKWQPAEGDTVQFKEGASDTGKSWEGVRFLQLANEFAGNHGLTFQNYGCTDQVYPYIKQDNETDFALFHRLCTLEGCQMLIFDGKLLAYNEQYIEGQTPAGSLSVDENGVFSYEDNRGGMYGSCEIASGSYSGKFIANSSNSSVLRPAVPIQVTSNAEAARFAKGLLRNANKFARSGYFSKSLMTGYAAASILTLSTPRATMWDGTVFVYKVRHDFVGNKSTIYFRHILEGY